MYLQHNNHLICKMINEDDKFTIYSEKWYLKGGFFLMYFDDAPIGNVL